MYRTLALFLALLPMCGSAALETQNRECVVLLHGLARGSWSMAKMARALEEAGYHAVNLGYSSRAKPVAELAAEVVADGVAECGANQPIHFVTHSLGGILVRAYLAGHELPRLGRVVMLGPPSQGSEVVDTFKNMPGFGLFTGKAGRQLGTDADSLPNQLGPVAYPVGVIAGDRTINFILSWLIPGCDDGKVSVERAQVAGMTDFLVLHHSHAFMMRSDEVIRQARYFLQNGRFYRPESGY